MVQDTARARQTRQKPDDRRTQILQAATTVIFERGLADARIADVAERAGVSAGLVIYYFGSKEHLLAQALAHLNDRFYLQVSRMMTELPTARARLEHLIDLSVPGYLEGDDDRRDEWALWMEGWGRALRDPQLAREREVLDRRWRETIAGVIRAGQTGGEFPPGDAEELALRLSAVMDGLSVQVVLNDALVTPERMRRTCLEMAAREIGFAL